MPCSPLTKSDIDGFACFSSMSLIQVLLHRLHTTFAVQSNFIEAHRLVISARSYFIVKSFFRGEGLEPVADDMLWRHFGCL